MTSFITDLLRANTPHRQPQPTLAPCQDAVGGDLPGFLESSGLVSRHSAVERSVLLRPGDWLFGRGNLRVSAMLGASLALVMWVPRYRLGAVCCIAHPVRPAGVYGLEGPCGLYGEDAVRWLDERLQRTACDWSDVALSLIGGAHQQGGCAGQRNVSWVQAWSATQHLVPAFQDVGGSVLRKLNFNLTDGSVTVTHGGSLGSVDV
ncbi:MAG: chemotaxis protein CheD [Aquabacterium sp.]|uniref:chemotaxis protein CheD n=1 Tax=Aquabacterium sp. TaxID=1872578 RepID=UPI0025BDEECC|nr:chemotaxis protein CheD [Aquabacterium sp.]MBI5924088.1 chemotaxis protein CheD [Aquabacterium sp.]